MEALFIEGRSDTPEVRMETNGSLEISGRSYPEDAVVFYTPLFSWLSHFLKTKSDPVYLKLKLEYFNTSSSKQLFKLLSLAEMEGKPGTVSIEWHYPAVDRDMKASGERFKKLVSLPISFVEY